MSNPLILGSASERRQNILQRLGVRFKTVIPEVAEITGGNPKETALLNAHVKNDWCSTRFPDSFILTADTVVCLNNRSYAKPANTDQAIQILRQLSGQTHSVFTAVVLTPPRASKRHPRSEIVESSVTFKNLDDSTIKRYVSTVRPFDRAGAYDINEHGNLIIQSYTGSYTNIMGLPAELIQQWLKEEGLLQ